MVQVDKKVETMLQTDNSAREGQYRNLDHRMALLSKQMQSLHKVVNNCLVDPSFSDCESNAGYKQITLEALQNLDPTQSECGEGSKQVTELVQKIENEIMEERDRQANSPQATKSSPVSDNNDKRPQSPIGAHRMEQSVGTSPKTAPSVQCHERRRITAAMPSFTPVSSQQVTPVSSHQPSPLISSRASSPRLQKYTGPILTANPSAISSTTSFSSGQMSHSSTPNMFSRSPSSVSTGCTAIDPRSASPLKRETYPVFR